MTVLRSNSEAICVSEIPFQTPFEVGNQFNAGALSQSASSNHALLIKKNALCLSQSALSNFALHVITVVINIYNFLDVIGVKLPYFAPTCKVVIGHL